MTKLTSVTHDAFYPYPIETVWNAITSNQALNQWLMQTSFVPRLGHQFKMQAPPIQAIKFNGVVLCEVTELDPPSRLAYSWSGGGLDAVVSYQLESSRENGMDGVQLHFEHSGFDLDTALGTLHHNGFSPAWPAIFDRALRSYLQSES